MVSTAEGLWVARAGTLEDLVADSCRRGEPVTERLVRDWTAKGLLDSPERRGAGQGLGSQMGVYSSNQRELFWCLLDKRAQVGRKVSRLAAVVLVMWAFWGDAYVPTRQARKALETSLGTRDHPEKAAERNARKFVEDFRHPDASHTDVNRLRRLTKSLLTTGRIEAPADFEATFRRVIDPHHEGRRLLPPGINVGLSLSPQQVVAVAMKRARAINAFRAGRVEDTHLERVRQELQATFVEYAMQNPLLAALSTQRLVDVARAHELQQLTDGISENIWLVLGALLDSQNAPQNRQRQAGVT